MAISKEAQSVYDLAQFPLKPRSCNLLSDLRIQTRKKIEPSVESVLAEYSVSITEKDFRSQLHLYKSRENLNNDPNFIWFWRRICIWERLRGFDNCSTHIQGTGSERYNPKL